MGLLRRKVSYSINDISIDCWVKNVFKSTHADAAMWYTYPSLHALIHIDGCLCRFPIKLPAGCSVEKFPDIIFVVIHTGQPSLQRIIYDFPPILFVFYLCLFLIEFLFELFNNRAILAPGVASID